MQNSRPAEKAPNIEFGGSLSTLMPFGMHGETSDLPQKERCVKLRRGLKCLHGAAQGIKGRAID